MINVSFPPTRPNRNRRNVGGSVTVPADGSRVTVCDFSRNDCENETDTIGVVLIVPQTFVTTTPNRIVATISIGCAATGIDFEMDYLRGAQFAVGSSGVRVSARLIPPPGGVGPANLPINVGAYVSNGDSLRTENVRLTDYTSEGAIAPTAFVSFPVPALANSFIFKRTPIGNTAVQINVLDSAGVPITETIFAPNVDMEIPFPIPGDGKQVLVTNIGAGAIARHRAMWNLSL